MTDPATIEKPLEISDRSRVRLNFALKLSDGQVVDSNFDQEPVNFQMGDGNLPPGFERCLIGLVEGAQSRFEVSAEHAFGLPNPGNFQRFTVDQLSQAGELVEGLILSFSDSSGTEVPGVIKELSDDSVLIDFNHPLAGRNLRFEVKIHGIELEEQGQGHTKLKSTD